MKYKTYLNEERLINVYYTTNPFIAGSTDGKYGPKIEPDEPAYIEIDYIEDLNGNIIELGTIDRKNIKEIKEEIAELLYQKELDQKEW